MRMWMVRPEIMCRQHLLGEHVECHMLVGSLRSGRSVQGFLERNLIQPQSVQARHDDLALEMLRRGYKHKSPLEQPKAAPIGAVSVESSEAEIFSRCEACRLRATGEQNE